MKTQLKKTRKRIAVIGSAFNPPHLGHKDVIEQVYRDFDEILLVPSYRHAFGKKMEPFKHRLYMASMLAQAFHRENAVRYPQATPIITSDIEMHIGNQKSGPVFTFDVLNQLEKYYQQANLDCELHFVVGPDNTSFDSWKKFYRGDEIIQRWKLHGVSERVNIRSTDVRRLMSSFRRPLKLFEARLKTQVEQPIAQYIFNHKLYGVHI